MKTNISHIGFFAQQVLERSKSALVSGIASRGIYLQPEDDWTLYISQEIFKGPLTLNLEEPYSLENIKTGSSAQFTRGEIYFPDEMVTISINGSKIWRSPRIDNKTEFIPERIDSILSLARKLAHGNPYLPLLSANPDQIPGVPGFAEKIQILRNLLGTGELKKNQEGLIGLLGFGPGLTPLGDDFLLGILLSLNQCGNLFFKDFLVEDINQIILKNAHDKTTRLSASLLSCAVEGAADERLLKVLDGLLSGSEITEAEMKDLLHWGSSSGIAALTGMILTLS